MHKDRRLLIFSAALISCLIFVLFTRSIQGGDRRYEVIPGITLPEYRTDSARAIDAYERLIERYMDITEEHFVSVNSDLREIVRKVYEIDKKLTNISSRIERIEEAMILTQHQPKTRSNKEQGNVLSSKEPNSLSDK